MRTNLLSAILIFVVSLLIVACKSNSPIEPEKLDTTPPSGVYAKSIQASPSPSRGNLTLSWGASSDAGSGVAFYKVHIVCYDNLGSYSNIFKPTTNSLPLSNLPVGRYAVDVTAIDNAGNESNGPLPKNGDFWSSGSFQVVADSTRSSFAGSASVPKGEFGSYLASNAIGQPDNIYEYLFVPYRSGEITGGGMYAITYTIDPLLLSNFQFNIPSNAVIKNVVVIVSGYTESGTGSNTVWAWLLSGQETIASATGSNVNTVIFKSDSLSSLSPAIVNAHSFGVKLTTNTPMYVDAVEVHITTE